MNRMAGNITWQIMETVDLVDASPGVILCGSRARGEERSGSYQAGFRNDRINK